ncbi:MAG: glycosyltransferase [Opitutales bacterium]
MNLLRIIHTLDPASGGPVAALRSSCRALAARGHPCTVVTADPRTGADDLKQPDDAFTWIPLGEPGHAARRFVPAIGHWLAEHRSGFDGIYLHGLWQSPTRAAGQALRDEDAPPWFVFPHGMLDRWFRKGYPLRHIKKQTYWWLHEGPVLAAADHVLFTSEEELARSTGTFRPWRLRPRIVAYGIEGGPGDHTPTPHRPPDLPGDYLLFLGRLHRKKGLDRLLAAWAAAAPAKHHLVLAGPDEDNLARPLREQAARLGVAERVHLPGLVRGVAKTGLLAHADALALVSHQENFGLVVAEALAWGKPVLLSTGVALHREVAACDAGLTGEPTQAGTRALLQDWYALSAERKAALGTAARRLYADRFSAERAAEDLVELVQECGENRGHG